MKGSFFKAESAGGALLMVATVLALIWANSPWQGMYAALFESELGRVPAREIINSGLMAFFFLLVGIEIKRELLLGELRSFRLALLPAVAAVGGMVLPVLLFLWVIRGSPGAAGWGIPVATDIAFAIGCLTLFRRRVTHAGVVFLTALAIFDDIGGIAIIALAYGHGVHWKWLLACAGVIAILAIAGRAHVRNGVFYFLGGLALWASFHASGIHSTLAGVALGLCIPATSASPRLLQTAVAFGIVPLFALANAGISLQGVSPSRLLSPLPLAIMVGLVVGKTLGIFSSSVGLIKAGGAQLPEGVAWRTLLGISGLGGIGFTVSLFIAQLAFNNAPDRLMEAKLGVLAGSALSAALGMGILLCSPLTAQKQV